MPTIFGAFTQGDESTTRRFEGTGVSLAVAHRFCELLGGELTATCTPGRGASFTVLLPVARESATRTPPEPAADLTLTRPTPAA